jgi:hypothetical protein
MIAAVEDVVEGSQRRGSLLHDGIGIQTLPAIAEPSGNAFLFGAFITSVFDFRAHDILLFALALSGPN